MTSNFFISSIYDNDIYIKTPNISYKGLLDYYENKEEIIKYENEKVENEEFEIIDKDDNIDEHKEMREGLMKGFDEERKRVKKVIEYLIVNMDMNSLELPYYKTYDYGDVPKYMKTKIKKHPNYFDINIFMNKNKMNKEFLIDLFDVKVDINKLSIHKICIYHIFYKIFDLYNQYNKALIYSIELLKIYPNLLKDDKYLDYLVKINPNQFNIINDEIRINHLNELKNAYVYKQDKKQMVIHSSSLITFHKEDKKYKIIFK